jgi:branched-chain amino acid transport system permease protein
VLIGGLRSVTGPLVGALVLIGLEEVLKATTEYWKLAEGLIVIAIVLALPNGVRQLMPLVFGSSGDDAAAPAKDKVAKSAAGASHG